MARTHYSALLTNRLIVCSVSKYPIPTNKKIDPNTFPYCVEYLSRVTTPYCNEKDVSRN